jgi:hypothetical protein
MVLHGSLAEGRLHLGRIGLAGHPKDFVLVARQV